MNKWTVLNLVYILFSKIVSILEGLLKIAGSGLI